MKCLFLTNLPSPYRVAFFNELGKYCDLTVAFERTKANNRDDTWYGSEHENFEAIYLKSKVIGEESSLSFQYKKILKKDQFDFIIICGYSSPTTILAIRYCRKKGIPYIIAADGAFIRKENKLKYLFKKYLLSKAQTGLGTNDETLEYLKSYGIKDVYKYPFTSLYYNDIMKDLTTFDEQENLKKKLNITESQAVISVGRFIPVKGFDVLINAFKKLDKNIGLYIVGGKPTTEYIELSKGFENIHFIDFMNKESLKEYYKATDLFVLMTRGDVWGLVVNEAMACGLPVITTDKCGAGLELIQNGVNGYIIPVDDGSALESKIRTILNDNSLQKSMASNNLQKIRNYTIESMAERHIEIFQEIKDKYKGSK